MDSPPSSPAGAAASGKMPPFLSSPMMTIKEKEMLNFAWPFPRRPSWFYRWKSKMTIFGVYCASKLMFCGLNRLVVPPEQKKMFLDLLRDESRPLITMCNHRCVIDDPLLWAMFTFREFYSIMSRYRYTLTAHNICFTKPLHTTFFSLGRCVPVIRGNGVFQQGVDYCLEQLNQNGWVHVFPEGKVTPEPIRIKWGIGRLIAECRLAPVLLPIWVQGMDEVWSRQPPYRPRFGKTVFVTIGAPIDMTKWRREQEEGQSPPSSAGRSALEAAELERRKRLADLCQAALFGLGRRVEGPDRISDQF